MLYNSELEDFSEFEGIISWYIRHIMISYNQKDAIEYQFFMNSLGIYIK